MSTLATVTDDVFAQQIKEGVVLVDFYATWCAPCKVLAPLLDEMAKEFDGRIKFLKLDTDASSETAAAFRISAVPTLILFKGGREFRRANNMNRANLRKFLEEALV